MDKEIFKKSIKLPRKLKKVCKKTVLLWQFKKGKDFKIVSYNRIEKSFTVEKK